MTAAAPVVDRAGVVGRAGRRLRTRRWTASAALLAIGGVCGCDDPGQIRPGDIRTYRAPQAAVSPAASPVPPAGAASSASQLAYELPEGWSTGSQASGMRLATLLIGDPADGREVTVIPASGSLRGNVERWQGQLDAEAAPEALAAAVDRALADARTVDVRGVEATVVLLLDAAATASGTGEAILGAMVPLDDTAALFVKFKGDASVARSERENFARFVSSLRWD